ncbi:MAG: 2-oxopent-4-enoate hydratase [Gammaproteobacteria bacterium]|nr:2-oxopent-4-enoate hydratase [Gammaproteobacteria bacterium]
MATIKKTGEALYACLRETRTMPPLSVQFPDLTIDDAYKISREFLFHRTTSGEKVVGKKIGVTSPAVQEMLGVYQPDFGFMTDAMWQRNGIVDTTTLIAPRAEAEIAFRLKDSLSGPGVTPEDVLRATESVIACFEIVDSRIENWDIKITDTVADNASCGVFVLSEEEVSPKGLDLAALKVVVEKNGEFLSEGLGSAVQGAPENAVAWLANTLGEYGIPLHGGEIVLSGSLVPLAPASTGDHFTMNIDGLGSAEVRFR